MPYLLETLAYASGPIEAARSASARWRTNPSKLAGEHIVRNRAARGTTRPAPDRACSSESRPYGTPARNSPMARIVASCITTP